MNIGDLCFLGQPYLCHARVTGVHRSDGAITRYAAKPLSGFDITIMVDPRDVLPAILPKADIEDILDSRPCDTEAS